MKNDILRNKMFITFAVCAALAVGAGAVACSSGSKNSSSGSSDEAADSQIGNTGKNTGSTGTGNGAGSSADVEEMALKITDKDRDTSYSGSDSKLIQLKDDMGAEKITEEGTYVVTGSTNNGMIIIDAGEENDVHLVLRDCTILSPTSAAVYVLSADEVYITLEGSNTLGNGGSYVAIDENDIDAVIYAKDDLTLNGSGTLNIDASTGHAIVCKDDMVITGGTYTLMAEEDGINTNDSLAITDGTFDISCGDDAIHTDGILQIDGGAFTIVAAEGLEGTYITINDGTFVIDASDDGINAAQKVEDYTATLNINGGDIQITMGAGDTDGLDSNGNLYINGGVISITAQSAVDYDGEARKTGGTLIVNGQETDSIPNQMMGGHGGMGGDPAGMQGGRGGMNGQMPDGQTPDGQFPEGMGPQDDSFRGGRNQGGRMG